MHKVLVITDTAKKNWNRVFHEHGNDDQYFIHSVNRSTESVLQVIKKHSFYKDFTINEIDTFEISQLAEKETRDYYLKLIRDLPNSNIFNGQSITDLLTINGRNYWWYLPISEKNIWVDKSIHRFYEIKKLQHILNIHKYDHMICNLSDAILQESFNQMAIQRIIQFTSLNPKYRIAKWSFRTLIFCFKYFINASKAIISLYIKKVFIINSIMKKNNIANGTIGFFSFSPLYWKNIETDHPKDIFFKDIPDEIAKKNRVVHLLWLSPWKKLLSNKKWLQRLQKNKMIYILENALKLRDAFSLFYLDIFKNLFFILFSNRKVHLGTIEGIKIDDIVYDEFFKSFSSPAFFQALLLDRALQKIPLKKCKLLFFRLEFQPHERAILYNTKGKVKSIGFQHSALSNNFLNYVFMKDELGKHWEQGSESSSMPLPDHIFTSGQVGIDYMSNAGYPKDHLSICGGLRYHELRKNASRMSSKNDLRNRYDLPNQKRIIFVATTPIIHETVAMLSLLYQAIQNQKSDNSEFYIVIKHHPNTRYMQDYKNKTSEIIDSLSKIIEHEIFWDAINVHEYIKMSDVVFTSGGTLPLEAMIIGVPSIIFSSNLNFTHNPLQNYPQSALFVNDISSMSFALKKVVHNELETEYNKNWYKPVNDMFSDYSIEPTISLIKSIRDMPFV